MIAPSRSIQIDRRISVRWSILLNTPMPPVIIKLKLIGMDRAVNPDFLEVVSHTNEKARLLSERYEQAGPFACADHPDEQPFIEVSAIFQSTVKVRNGKFCCQALADQVEARMAEVIQ